jgi:hypothetical protein
VAELLDVPRRGKVEHVRGGKTWVHLRATPSSNAAHILDLATMLAAELMARGAAITSSTSTTSGGRRPRQAPIGPTLSRP